MSWKRKREARAENRRIRKRRKIERAGEVFNIFLNKVIQKFINTDRYLFNICLIINLIELIIQLIISGIKP